MILKLGGNIDHVNCHIWRTYRVERSTVKVMWSLQYYWNYSL